MPSGSKRGYSHRAKRVGDLFGKADKDEKKTTQGRKRKEALDHAAYLLAKIVSIL